MKAPLYTQSGEKKGEVTLRKEMFEAPVRNSLMHQAMVRHLSNKRVDTAFTLVRSEVRGGGRKPYKQKGTGQSRQGSIRSPLWKGGGVIFGPRAERNYEKLMPKRMRREALFSALSSKAHDSEIVVLDSFSSKTPKTKIFVEMLKKLPVKEKILIVLPGSDTIFEKSTRNIPNVRVILVSYLNVVDLLWADSLLFLEASLEKAEEIFLTK
ncbi:50S ribosomal protein L4 [Candidatus Peregrinibacteria bacterium]|nr:50S ribosomal protein L4 [Candidatus Peregrinibacteria bacterium]